MQTPSLAFPFLSVDRRQECLSSHCEFSVQLDLLEALTEQASTAKQHKVMSENFMFGVWVGGLID